MMSIFSPRSSRMIDCTRMPFMPTQAPTLSTSRSRLCTAILVRSPASRAHALDHHRAVVDLRNFLSRTGACTSSGAARETTTPGAFAGLVHAARSRSARGRPR